MTQEAIARASLDAPTIAYAAPSDAPGAAIDEAKQKPTQAARLVSLATEAVFFRTPDGEALADFKIDGHRETHRLRGNGFKNWLTRRFYEETGRPPSAQALSDAMGVFASMAQFDGEERPVFVRVAFAGDRVYLDLGRPDWAAVEVSADGWCLVTEPPVRFRRPNGMHPLPVPVQGGRLDELMGILNIREEDWPLLAGWLVMALHPKGPYPILILKGEQGTGKTSAAEKIKAILDPGKAALRAEPRELRDLMIAAGNSWCMGYDNLSHMPAWLSDSLCRISTGSGFAVRAHYENAEEALFEATRPVLINGIDDLATRSDLLDRTVIIETPPLGERERRTKDEIDLGFVEMHPRLLGALLEAVSSALANRHRVHLDRLPRMADFALWATAAEPALGIASGGFMRAYLRNRAGAHHAIVDASPVARAIEELLCKEAGHWSGTSSELYADLVKFLDDMGKRNFPRSPKALSDAIRRLAPNLRAVGIEARPERTANRRKWILEKLGASASSASYSSADPKSSGAMPLLTMTQAVTRMGSISYGIEAVTHADNAYDHACAPKDDPMTLLPVDATHRDEDDAGNRPRSSSVKMITEDL